MLKQIKQSIDFIKNNKLFVAKLALMGYVAVSVNCDPVLASTTIDSDLPFASGVKKIYDNMTGPIAQVGAGVAVCGAAYGWLQGDSQMAKTATRICIGTGTILGAPTLVSALSSSGSSGALF
ncbi:TrbC/VirB2 family protein [Megamonas hypermegale]|uniref:TrbC/VirB2 family protein n=1 Tax=Megamonas hypermegale TaxID=158847 RepID=UPI00242D1A94|nr:TrbC/VirB2 family protein [Megamonas hypermegale]